MSSDEAKRKTRSARSIQSPKDDGQASSADQKYTQKAKAKNDAAEVINA